MRTLHWITFLAGLLLFSGWTNAAIVTINRVDVSPNVGDISVGVFLTNDTAAELLLGAYDVPIDFGAPGMTVLPAGITYLGLADSIITLGSTLASIADPTGLGDIIVSDVSTSFPPQFPPIAAGDTARLVNLRFNIGAVALGTGFDITPIAGHGFFNLSDSTAAVLPLTGVVAGGLQVVPEPSGGLLALSMCAGWWVVSRRKRGSV